jgi:hypothetical protein
MPDYKLKSGGILTEQELALYAEELGLTPEQYLEEKSFLFEEDELPAPAFKLDLENLPKDKEGIQAAVNSIVPENSYNEIAEKYFDLKNAPQKMVQVPSGMFGTTTSYVQDDDRLEEYLGNKYEQYLSYKETGEFDLTKVDQNLKTDVILERKGRVREQALGRLSDEEREVLTLDITGADEALAKAQTRQKKDAQDYFNITGDELTDTEEIDGRTFYGPEASNLLKTPEFKAVREQQRKVIEAMQAPIEQSAESYTKALQQYEQDARNFQSQIAPIEAELKALGNVDQYSSSADIQRYNDLIAEYQNNFEAEANRLNNFSKQLEKEGYSLQYNIEELNKKIEDFYLGEEEIAGLVKDYSRLNLLGAVVENSWAGITTYLAKFAKLGIQYSPGGITNVEGLLQGLKIEQQAIDYYSRTSKQMETFPAPLKLGEGNAWSDLIADGLIRNSPSIAVNAATLASGGIIGAARAATLTGSAFFLMEGGGKLGDMELTQRNAKEKLPGLKIELENATSDYLRKQIQKEIEYYEDALSQTEFEKVFVATSFGAIAGAAEAFGNLALFKNFGKIGRSYGSDLFKKAVGNRMGRILAKSTGVGAAFGGGVGIEELEETLTQLGHNFIDIAVLGEEKSLIDGLDPEFFFNTALSSLVIQGGGATHNVAGVFLNELSTSRETAQFSSMQKELIGIQTQLESDQLNREQRLGLRKRRRAVMSKMARLTEVTIASMGNLKADDATVLFEINSALRQNANDAAAAGMADETGAYKNNLLNRLNKQRAELTKERDALLKDINIPVDLRAKAKYDADAHYRFGRFNMNLALAGKIKGTTQIVIKGNTDAERLAAAEKLIADPKNNFTENEATALRGFVVADPEGKLNNGMFFGKKTFINQTVIESTIASDKFSNVDKDRAIEAPIEEIGHAYMLSEGLAKRKTDIVSKDINQVKKDLKKYFKYQYDSGILNKEDKEEIDKIISLYEETQFNPVEEIIMIIGNLQRTGMLKGSGSTSLYSIKKLTKNLLEEFFPKQGHLFAINTTSDALNFLAKLAQKTRAGARLQLPEKEKAAFAKASLNVGPMSDSQLEKVKGSLQKLGRDENGVFDKNNFDPNSVEIFNALPGMIYAQAQKRAIKGLQFDMEELIQETTLQLLKNKDISKYDGRGQLYGYLNGRIKFRIGDAFNANPSIVTDFGEASMEDLTQQFSQEESDDAITRQETAAASAPISPGMPNRVSFSKALDKMMPGLINNEVKQVFYNALEKFLQTKDQLKGFRTARLDWQKSEAGIATNEKGQKLFTNVLGNVITQAQKEALPRLEQDKYSPLMNQELTLQPEEAKFLREIIAEFLEKEITKYLRLEVIANPADKTGRFKRLVESSFDLYKIIPQEFLNSRIKNWIEPDLHTEGPNKGKQKRETVLDAGAYGGAKGNPLYKRIKLTEQEWKDYWLAPGKGASTRGKLKERFAILIAQEYGKDLMLEFLNDQEKLDLFLAQQKLPSSNQINNLGMAMTVALERDPGAFKLKYSINASDAPLVLQAMPELVGAANNALLSKRFTIQNLIEEFKQIFKDSEINPEAIEGLAKYFTSSFKKRKRTLRIKQERGEISKLNKEEESLAMQEAMAYYIFGNYGGFVTKFTKDKNQINSLYGSKKGEDWKLNENKIYDLTNQRHAIGAINYLIENEGYTIFEIWDVLGASLNSGTYLTVFSNNQDFFNAFENQFKKEGIDIKTSELKNKKTGKITRRTVFVKDNKELTRTTQNINGPKVALAFNTNANNAVNEYNENAEQARKDLEKLIVAFENRLKKAENSEQEQIILHQAAILFGSMQTDSKSTGRKIAKVSHYEADLNAKNALFEHSTPIGLIMGLIGDRLNKKITKEQFDKFIEEKATAVVLDGKTTDKVLSVFFKNNLPMDIDILKDDYNQLARYMHSLVARDLKGKVLIGVDGNKTIEFDKLPHAQSAEQIAKGKFSLNTTRNLTIVPVYEYNTLTGEQGELLKYRSEMFRIMSGPFEYYYELSRLYDGRVLDPDIIAEDAVTDDLLALSFFRYDTDLEQDSTDLTNDFTEGERNPIKVFSIIGNSVMDFMKKQGKFKGVMFSADAETMSRVKLYDRFANMMAQKFGYEVLIQDIKGPASGELFYRRYYVVDPAYIENGKLIKPKPAVKYSLNGMSKDFNLIIEDKFGIEEYKRFSQIVGKRRGAKIDKFNVKQWFFPPSAEDFMGLMYDLLGKGKNGDAQMQWFVDNIVLPYTDGIAQIDAARQSIKRTYRNLLTENKGIRKLLQQKTPDGDYTYDQALRVYLWNKQGEEIPGLSERDRNKLVELISGSQELQDFANVLLSLPNMEKGYPKPSEFWDAETLLSDLNGLTEKTNRKAFLSKFIENIDIIFSEQNKNKLRAALGNNWVEALEDILYRMENGTNRPSGSNRIVNAWNNWVNRSIGAIMFFNRRSAVLQLLSTVNFINWSDNNPVKAAAAFANQKQYWKDFAYIFNSDKLKERRGGLRTDVSEAEIANAAERSKGDPGAILSYLLKIGFTLTQIADSFAISSGGATFYRNRIKTYVKEGMTQKEAEAKAWSDFSRISDETQQSSDPMLISQEQASVLGRLILAFQNTSAQYTRRGRKGIRNIINGRGDFKTELSVSLYYLAIQNIIFNSLQSALFTFIPGFDGEEEDEELTDKELERKQQKESSTWTRAINGTLDTVLRGAGLRGAVVATLKNTIMKFYEQEQKDPFFKDNAQIVLEALNLSPPIGSKARKFYNALRTRDFEKDVIEERGWDLFIDGKFKPSPIYSVVGNIAAAVANAPLDRVYDEVVSISEAFDARNTAAQRAALSLGYKSWAVGAKQEEEDLIKERAKALRKEQGIEKAKATRKRNKQKADSIQNALELEMMKKLPLDEYLQWLKSETYKKKKKK